MILLLYLVPAIIAMVAVAALGRYSKWTRRVALAGSAFPLASIPVMYALGSVGQTQSIPWFSAGGYGFAITSSLAGINLMLFVLVAVISPVVFVYSIGYMDRPSEDRRYYIELLAFEIAMLAFSMSGDFLSFMAAWGFLSLTSYLLIGFYHRPSASRAARTAMTTVLIGDVSLLGAAVLFWSSYGTLQFSQLISIVQATGSLQPVGVVAVVLVLVAAMTKSAQIPFTGWLPEAMEGPTPVSAFLHSSTMVKTGVFTMLLLFPLFRAAGLLQLILWIGIITAIAATVNAVRDTNVKRVLAYSTVQELSLMLIAIGLGSISAAILLFIVQAFYKAALFFYSGILIKANGTEEMRDMKRRWGGAYAVFAVAVAVLSLAGIAPLSGFLAGAQLQAAAAPNLPVYAVLLAIDLVTSFFITRWLILPISSSTGSQRTLQEKQQKVQYVHTSKPMLYAFIAMVAFTALSAALAFAAPQLLQYVYPSAILLQVHVLASIAETALVIAGIAAAYYIFTRQLYSLAYSKTVESRGDSEGIVSSAYSYLSVFICDISTVSDMFEAALSNAFDSIGMAATRIGAGMRHAETGEIDTYAIAFVIGMVILVVSILLVV